MRLAVLIALGIVFAGVAIAAQVTARDDATPPPRTDAPAAARPDERPRRTPTKKVPVSTTRPLIQVTAPVDHRGAEGIEEGADERNQAHEPGADR